MIELPLHQKGQPDLVRRPGPRRSTTVFSLIIFALLFTTYNMLSASSSPATEIMEEASTSEDEFEFNSHHSFRDLIQLADLPAKHLPQTGAHHARNRLIIVGDVHGMRESLLALLSKVSFDAKHDHLILAGDMISKGPDSAGVIDLAIELGATGIRGNHEDSVLLAHAHMMAQGGDASESGLSGAAPDREDDGAEEEDLRRQDHKARATARKLGEKRIKWLKKCPVILRVGKLGRLGEVVVVHAGLAPGVELKRQDPIMVMNMRTIDGHGVPSEEREGKAWNKVWNKYQKTLPKDHRTTVIYGHDSKRGLQVKKYSMGIDTGCLKGGKLTAVVIGGGHSEYSHDVVHVGCPDGRSK